MSGRSGQDAGGPAGRAPGGKGRPLSVSDRGDGPYVRRFSTLDRTLHALLVVSFLGLVLTGTPLHFSDTPWGGVLIRLLGGVQAAGFLHRACAVVSIGAFLTHLGSVVHRATRSPDRRRFFFGPDSMVPRPQDARDVVQMFRWFFGRGPFPRFDRFSYLEKFDYWGEVWGVTVIGGSGLLLWFPEFFSLFLPGWIFNVATIVHGVEALIALGFIFAIHFFNVHLRPGKFPIDTVVFTGRATLDYMRDEHPLYYERLMRENRIRELLVPPLSTVLQRWSVGFGFASLTVGIWLIGLVLWAVLS